MRPPFTREEFDTFTKEELDRQRQFYEDGSGSRWSEAHVLARHDKDKKPFKTVVDGKDTDQPADFGRIIMAMPDLTDQQVRDVVKKVCWEHDAIAVAVKMEVWYVSLPVTADPWLIELVTRAKAERTIHKLKPPIRGEAVHFHVEAENFPIRMFTAEITYDPPPPVIRKPEDAVFAEDEDHEEKVSEEEQEEKEKLPKRRKILGPWEEQKLSLPRPNFRRYLPEMRDGKKTYVMHLPQGAPPDLADLYKSFLKDPELKALFEAGNKAEVIRRMKAKLEEVTGETIHDPEAPESE